MKINIAIDGPSAAGKSTIAKTLSDCLGYVHVDTGAMYRLVAYKILNAGIDIDDEEKISTVLKNTDIKMLVDGTAYLDGKLIGDEIRTNELSIAASDVSKLLPVREFLVDSQQKMAKDKGFIMDGRDIGTVVLTDAELKIFLTASSEARANRRHLQNIEKNIPSDYEEIKKDIEYRDYQDSNRVNSPLKQADDAYLIDSSMLSIEEVVKVIMDMLEEKGVNCD